VSTDYDVSDRLYFEELSLERVLDIYEQEQAWGLVVSVGGQIPQNLAKPLHDRGARVLGTSPDDIDRAEDRHKFSSLLDDLGVDQPPWRELQSVKDAQARRGVPWPSIASEFTQNRKTKHPRPRLMDTTSLGPSDSLHDRVVPRRPSPPRSSTPSWSGPHLFFLVLP
jgi:hypothetical protein